MLMNELNPANKWNRINQLMRDKKIAVLAVQETHMDDDRRQAVEQVAGRRLKIVSSADPTNPSGRGGVAVVLNQQLVHSDELQSIEIVPGRAILVTLKFSHEEKLRVLAIYAPNNAKDNELFWRVLQEYFAANPRKRADIMIGDFNVVEDAIDRIPSHTDNAATVDALDDLKRSLNLVDGWRETYPDTKAFTFFQESTKSQSRIDLLSIL